MMHIAFVDLDNTILDRSSPTGYREDLIGHLQQYDKVFIVTHRKEDMMWQFNQDAMQRCSIEGAIAPDTTPHCSQQNP